MDFSFKDMENNGGGNQGGGTVTAQVTLEWDANTEPDLEGYKVYYGNSAGIYDFTIDVGNQTSYTVTGLNSGDTYHFSATAYNTSHVESAFASEVSYAVPL